MPAGMRHKGVTQRCCHDSTDADEIMQQMDNGIFVKPDMKLNLIFIPLFVESQECDS